MIQEILTYIVIIWALFKLFKSIFYTFKKQSANNCSSGKCSHSCNGCAFKTNFDYNNKINPKKLF